MTVEYLPVGVKCNLKCTYCYQEPMRDAGNFSAPLDFIGVKKVLDGVGDFAVFGGEPLLASIEHLEEVWRYGFERHGRNGIQTNGVLIGDAHVALFKKYNVQVGLSIDGPGACNSPRCDEIQTFRIINNIKRLLLEKISTSLIVTIHKENATRLPELLGFFQDMEHSGVKYINLHNLEVDNCATDNTLKLTDEANFEAFRQIYDATKLSKVQFLPFEDIRRLLTARNSSVSCTWNNCDPITTPAVHGINPEGSLVNCGRTNKIGIDFLKGEGFGQERYKALARTPISYGGCKGCTYFFACKGQCPGTAIDGDWRNRTKDCVFWYSLIDYIRKDLVANCAYVLDTDKENDYFIQSLNRARTNQHGDVPHGDAHGDHTDANRGRESFGGVRPD